MAIINWYPPHALVQLQSSPLPGDGALDPVKLVKFKVWIVSKTGQDTDRYEPERVNDVLPEPGKPITGMPTRDAYVKLSFWGAFIQPVLFVSRFSITGGRMLPQRSWLRVASILPAAKEAVMGLATDVMASVAIWW